MFLGLPMRYTEITSLLTIRQMWICWFLTLVSDSNKSNQRLQRQVNYVLFIQSGMPIVGNLMGLCLNFLIMNTESMVFFPHFLALANMVVNPLLTMLLVDSYRRAVFNLCLCKSATVPDTVIVVSSIVRKQ
ncbi:hypothetical protein Ddc_16517 [Ditylenchus destructor]|nr:hypothetical protein Ddc_16517 [Ditylenchus destructor]